MEEKQKLKKERGITLVALVVTIIVLIILAGISINLVLGENGIISKTKYSKQVTLNSQVAEQEQLNEVASYLETLGENNNTSQMHNWIETGDTFKCTHCNVSCKVGQPVNYKAAGKNSTIVTAAKSGLDEMYEEKNYYPEDAILDEDGNQTIEVKDTTWVVLGIEDADNDNINESLLITTSEDLWKNEGEEKYGLALYGKAGYNNAVSYDDEKGNKVEGEIDRICRELYSNTEYGQARGITVEDVNNLLKYNPTKTGYFFPNNDGDVELNEIDNLTTKIMNLPENVWNTIKEGGTNTPDKANTEEALGNYQINYYGYVLNPESLNLEDMNRNTIKTINEIQKSVIFGINKEMKYWLSSRSVGIGEEQEVIFGIGSVAEYVCDLGYYTNLFNSREWEFSANSHTLGLRPVVSLKNKLPEISPTITIKIGDSTYEAKYGQTWGEWVEETGKDYGFYIYNNWIWIDEYLSDSINKINYRIMNDLNKEMEINQVIFEGEYKLISPPS